MLAAQYRSVTLSIFLFSLSLIQIFRASNRLISCSKFHRINCPDRIRIRIRIRIFIDDKKEYIKPLCNSYN